MQPPISFQHVKEKVDIIDIASLYCELQSAGSKKYRPKANPLRDERTSSLVLYADSQRWYDFGTGIGGDVLDFVSMIEEISTTEAAKRLSLLIGKREVSEALHTKNESSRESVSKEQLEREFNGFEQIFPSNVAHREELLSIAPRWLYDEASKDDLQAFRNLVRFDPRHQTLICAWLDIHGEIVSYKHRRFYGSKWANRKDTQPNNTAYARIHNEASAVYVIEGAHDALTATLLGLNFVAIPSTGYKNTDELETILKDLHVCYIVEDKQGFQCMRRLSQEVQGKLICLANDKNAKCDLSDFVKDRQSINEVLNEL